MSFAFLPLYTGDYLRDTQHLSCAEHGIYLKLLIHCWDQQGPVPLDERKLFGIVNARSSDEIEAMRRVLSEFFVQMDDGWYNKRMQQELERAAAISNKRKSAGAKGYQAKAKQMLSNCPASATTLTPTLTLTPTPTTTKVKTISSERTHSRSSKPADIGDGEEVTTIQSLKGEVTIRRSFISDLIEAYPAVMVGQEIDRAKLWLDANPTKRKTNVRKFLTNWMSRTQEKGGSR